MVAAAQRRLDGPAISFQVSSFEDFAAADASFDLIVSGTAFHWVDPEVRFRKPALLCEVRLTQGTSLTMVRTLSSARR